MHLKGSMVALVTPMNENGSIDYHALDQLIDWHITANTGAIVVAGTTGESATLSTDEYSELISHTVQQVNHRIPVIAGSGSNSTDASIRLTRAAKEAGADACLIVTPYYNKPTQQGLYEHYKTIAQEVGLPIILYNVPGRTACDLQADTVEKLSKVAGVIGIKEATGDLERAREIIKRCDKSFTVLSGDDPTGLGLMKLGGHGVISVTANIAPAEMAKMCEAALNKQDEAANQLNETLMPLHKKLFVESNPIPAKWALNAMGKIKTGIRLPLLPLDKQYHDEVKQAMQNAGVIKK